MTRRVLLLWRPAPTSDALVRTLRASPAFGDATKAGVADLTGRRRVRPPLRRRLRRRLRRPLRRSPGWLWYVPVDGDLDGLDDALASPPRRTQVVLLLPSARHQVEQVYREHVLGGAIDEFTPYRLREDLDTTVAAWRERASRIVDRAGGRTVVVDDPAAAATALAEAAEVGPDDLRSRLEPPTGISARGLEILRRMNAFTRTAAERRTTRRFCTKTFPAEEPAELDIPDRPDWSAA